MSVEQRQREVNNLDKEISSLEQKKAKVDMEISSLRGKIISTQKSITKNTSSSVLNMKLKQIELDETKIETKSKESSYLGKNIADKRRGCKNKS